MAQLSVLHVVSYFNVEPEFLNNVGGDSLNFFMKTSCACFTIAPNRF